MNLKDAQWALYSKKNYSRKLLTYWNEIGGTNQIAMGYNPEKLTSFSQSIIRFGFMN